MTRPLQPGDPTAFGPFTVDSRLADSPAGVVFLGSDGEGRRAAIATLSGPAAEDMAMQQRFREVADPAELYDGGEGVRVLAADLDGTRPWVATSYDGVTPGAERVFEELSTSDATARYFQPFTQYPAEPGYAPRGRPGLGAPRRTWWWWVVVGLVLLALTLLLLVLLAQCGGDSNPNPSGTPSGTPSQSQSGSPSSGSPSQSQSSGSPSQSTSGSPSQSGSGSPTPSPSGTGSGTPGTGTGEPTGAPLRLPTP
ncbi:MAG: hypothetical protein GEV10_05835 [Streptosporangiales bacterium]|nr:hypothetical protein [Streptosporangiales bacterium]